MQRIELAQMFMHKFAVQTGIECTENSDVEHASKRYLWTDAFAVCNYLGFYHQSKNPLFLQQALQLVEQVHHILGKHRHDSNKKGWLSGLSDQQARLHPTQGGLRIGKPLNERQPEDPFDQSLEWQQDGQYFHYLTKWMHALNCVSRCTGDSQYNRWALELAKTAFAAFVYATPQDPVKKMYWKMSIELARPLVMSMGLHDPLDGLLTYQRLNTTARQFADIPRDLYLEQEITDMSAICAGQSWFSHDALGIGGLLTDAYLLMLLITKVQKDETDKLVNLLPDLLHDIESSLHAFIKHNPFSLHAEHRLAFRELGLAIGLQCLPKMQQLMHKNPVFFADRQGLDALLNSLAPCYPLHDIIEQFWLKPKHQVPSSWQQHVDINSVMLATSLYPDGYLNG